MSREPGARFPRIGRARRPQDAEVLRFTKLIVTAGDEMFDIPEYILSLCREPLGKLFFRHETASVEAIIGVSEAMPTKIGIMTSIVGVLCSSSSDTSNIDIASFVKSLLDELAIRITRASYITPYLRLLAGLVSIGLVREGSFFALLDSIISAAPKLEQDAAAVTSIELDHALFTVLSTLPWLSKATFKAHEDEVTRIVSFSEKYIAKRQTPWRMAMRVFQKEDLPDRLETLVAACSSLTASCWQAKATCRFYQNPIISEVISVKNSFAIPAVTIDPVVFFRDSIRPIEAVLHLPVTLDAVSDILATHDRWLVEDHVLNVVSAFQTDPLLCAQQLLRMPIASKQFDYILVETLLSEMCGLPKRLVWSRPAGCPTFYAILLRHIATLQPCFVVTVEKCVQSLVKRLVDLDWESYEILCDFLGYWLTTINFEWDFDAWLTVHKPSPVVVQFITDALNHVCDLSYRNNVLEKLPQVAKDLMPPEPILQSALPEDNTPINIAVLHSLLVFSFPQHHKSFFQAKVGNILLSMLQNPPLLEMPVDYVNMQPASEAVPVEPPAKKVRTDIDFEMPDELGDGIVDYEEEEKQKESPWLGATDNLVFDTNESVPSHSEVCRSLLTAFLIKGSKSNSHLIRLIENFGFLFVLLRPQVLEARKADENFMDICEHKIYVRSPLVFGAGDVFMLDCENQDVTKKDREYYTLIIDTVLEFCSSAPRTGAGVIKEMAWRGLIPADLIIEALLNIRDKASYNVWPLIDDILTEMRLMPSHNRGIDLKPEPDADFQPNYSHLREVIAKIVERVCADSETAEGGVQRQLNARIYAFVRKYEQFIEPDSVKTQDQNLDSLLFATRYFRKPISPPEITSKVLERAINRNDRS